MNRSSSSSPSRRSVLSGLPLRRLMHLVLAAAATDAAIACGGAISSDIDDTDPSGTGSGTSTSSSSGSTSSSGGSSSSSGGSTSSSGGSTSSSGGSTSSSGTVVTTKDGGNDAKADVVFVDVQQSDVWVQSCVTGSIAFDPAFCCATPNDPACMGSGGGDNACSLDCVAVCEKMAPGKTGGFNNCYGGGTTTAPTISYMCGACGVGRIPEGTADCERGTSIGERLAMQAYYEAASVIAFRRLAEVLTSESAPSSLIDRVLSAAADEERHAVLFTRLATDRNACVKMPAVMNDEERHPSLLDLAIENAREGCVRETYGALVALHQSTHAEDEELRAAFASIADDEIAHAALSWDLAAFFEERLGASHLVHRNAAVVSLRVASMRDYDSVDSVLGVPSPDKAKTLFDDLFARLAA